MLIETQQQQAELDRLRRENERQRERLMTLQIELDLWRAFYRRLSKNLDHLNGAMDLAPIVRE